MREWQAIQACMKMQRGIAKHHILGDVLSLQVGVFLVGKFQSIVVR